MSDKELGNSLPDDEKEKQDNDAKSDEVGTAIEKYEDAAAASIEGQHTKQAKDSSSKSDTRDTRSEKPTKTPRRFSRVLLIFAVLLLIVLVGGSAASGYYFYQQLLVQTQLNDDERTQIVGLQRSIQSLTDDMQRAANERSQTANGNRALTARLTSAEKRLVAQNKRLLSMSTTSREDWLLAEAEYLLKLANQRVLVERKADSAIGLFEEADGILRDLSDPDLFPIRDVIKRDLVALKLAKSVDVEGIYLELSALAAQVEKLPLVPKAYHYKVDEAAESQEASVGAFTAFINSMKSYVRVINHDEKPVAILPPDATAYLHLNLRLMIERAQLALLREQVTIYSSSLKDAEQWVTRYFPNGQASMQYQHALNELAGRDIQTHLPDVTGSLELLHSYIADLHKLNSPVTRGTKPPVPKQAVISKPPGSKALPKKAPTAPVEKRDESSRQTQEKATDQTTQEAL